MLMTVNDITVRLDDTGRVRYARCNRTNRFVKHSVAQAALRQSRIEASFIVGLAVLANLIAIYFMM